MLRVVKPGGHIVFDIITEECMTPEIVGRWVARGIAKSSYPWMMARKYTVDLFASNGATLHGRFFAPLKPGMSEVLVFTKGLHGAG